MNPVTYPNFLSFLKHQKIEILSTEMSFSVSRDMGAFEWSGSGVSSVFTQLSNLWNLDMYRMILDILGFNTFAPDLLNVEETNELREMSIMTYLDQNNYSKAFRDNYLIVLPTPYVSPLLMIPSPAFLRLCNMLCSATDV